MSWWPLSWWRAWQRRTDIEILWPVCKQHAVNLTQARQMFFVHAAMDPAWRDGLSEDELVRTINELT